MKIFYDKEADIMFVELREGDFAKNKKLDDDTILDLDKDGNILGIEILDASKKLSAESLSEIEVRHFLPVAHKQTVTYS